MGDSGLLIGWAITQPLPFTLHIELWRRALAQSLPTLSPKTPWETHLGYGSVQQTTHLLLESSRKTYNVDGQTDWPM